MREKYPQLFEAHGKYDKTNSRTNYFLRGKNEINEVLLIKKNIYNNNKII